MQIARLDSAGVLIGVETVSQDDWKTDIDAKTVQLPPNHDMHLRIRSYRFDFLANRFEPIMVLDRTGEGAIEFGDAVVEAIHLLSEEIKLQLPSEIYKALGARPGK